MGLGPSSEQVNYAAELHRLLTRNGHNCSRQEVTELVKVIYANCQWLPKEGTYNLRDWMKVRASLQGHPKVTPTHLYMWGKVRSCLNDLTPANIYWAGKVQAAVNLPPLPQILLPLEKGAIKPAGDGDKSKCGSIYEPPPFKELPPPPPRSPIQEAEDTVLMETGLGGGILGFGGVSEETGSQEQNRRGKEDEHEAVGCASNLCDSSDSQTNGKKSDGKLESPSALGISGPGGSSIQKKPASLKLMNPIVAAEAGYQEEGGGSLPFPPAHEEGALQIMEPLSNVEKAAPPAEPCILFSEKPLGLACEGKSEDTEHLKAVEPHPSPDWLDELLASPPPSTDDEKRRSLPKLENPIEPEDLLGWSQKNPHSKFRIVEGNQSATFDVGWAPDISKVDWPGETEQDQVFDPGIQDWPTSYNVGDTQRQDVEFCASQQDWTKGTPLLGSSNLEPKECLTAFSSSCSEQQVKGSDWSSPYSISTAECQEGDSYVRKPGWPKLCTGNDDQENVKHVPEKTGWSSQYHAEANEKSGWSNICFVETASCPEPDVNTTTSTESSKYPIIDLQDTKLSIGYAEGSSDAIEAIPLQITEARRSVHVFESVRMFLCLQVRGS